jgi:hypothetical protein
MKFVISISHAIPDSLNHVDEPFENFDNFHVTMGFFQAIDHKCVIKTF